MRCFSGSTAPAAVTSIASADAQAADEAALDAKPSSIGGLLDAGATTLCER
jgi:hypothetical protein